MNPLTLIPWPVRLIALAAIIAAAGAAGWVKGAEHEQNRADKREAVRETAILDQVNQANARSNELAAQARTLKEKHDAEIADIDSRLVVALDQLRQRPARRYGGPDLPKAPAACTGLSGAELAARDAEFLVRYSYDAARLYSAIQQCEAQYRSVTN